jgi:hypothetical protein
VRYFFYLTNDWDTSRAELVFDANDRCDQENLIAQLKGGVPALRAPVSDLESNGAYMVMASLAWILKVCAVPARGRSLGREVRGRDARGVAHGVSQLRERLHPHCSTDRAPRASRDLPRAGLEPFALGVPPWLGGDPGSLLSARSLKPEAGVSGRALNPSLRGPVHDPSHSRVSRSGTSPKERGSPSDRRHPGV